MEFSEHCPQGPGRRHERFGTACRARIRIQNRHYAGSLENISISGAKILTFSVIRDEGPTTLLIPDLPPIGGTLRWYRDKVAGVLFERLLDRDLLERWLESRLVCEPSLGLPLDRYSASMPGERQEAATTYLHEHGARPGA